MVVLGVGARPVSPSGALTLEDFLPNADVQSLPLEFFLINMYCYVV